MSVTFSPVTVEPTDPALIEKHGFPPVMFCHTDDHPLAVNMSNINAGVVLRAMGFEMDDEGWVGSCAPAEFLGRIEVARIVNPVDIGVPVHEVPGPGARMIDCGRPAGYLQMRLDELEELGSACLEHGWLVGWC